MKPRVVVLSPGRCGSTSAARWVSLAYPSEEVFHLHSFCKSNRHLLPRHGELYEDRDAEQPDHDERQKALCREVRERKATGLRVLVLVRDPLSRDVSAWRAFQKGQGNFSDDFDHAAAIRWYDSQVFGFLGVDIGWGSHPTLGRGPIPVFEDRTYLRLAVVRYEELEKDVPRAMERLLGEAEQPALWERLNPSSPEDPVPFVSPDLAAWMLNTSLATRLYSPEEREVLYAKWVR